MPSVEDRIGEGSLVRSVRAFWRVASVGQPSVLAMTRSSSASTRGDGLVVGEVRAAGGEFFVALVTEFGAEAFVGGVSVGN